MHKVAVPVIGEGDAGIRHGGLNVLRRLSVMDESTRVDVPEGVHTVSGFADFVHDATPLLERLEPPVVGARQAEEAATRTCNGTNRAWPWNPWSRSAC